MIRAALAYIFAAIAGVLAFTCCGCNATTPCPELATFRAGLHPADEALYKQHQQLMADAVALDAASKGKTITDPALAAAVFKAKRSPTEQQILAAEVDAVERLYAAGAATQPSNP